MISVKDAEMVGENIIKFDTEGTNSHNNLISVPPTGINKDAQISNNQLPTAAMGNNQTTLGDDDRWIF